MDTQYHVADSLTEETHEVASLREVIGIFNEIGVSDFVFHRQDSDLSYDCGPNEAHCVRGLHSYEVCQLERMK
jgi:hypothetical protein